MTPSESFWVFAYGSLMWDPGFAPETVLPARVFGYHRRFCLYSTNYRGTEERPGLVLGLDRGGSCTGLLLHVAEHQSEQVRAALWEREMFGGVYSAKTIQVMPTALPHMDAKMKQSLEIAAHKPIAALAFVINRTHPRYAGKLCLDAQARLISVAEGRRGPNLVYLSETVASLQKLGCCPPDLVTLLEKTHSCCAQAKNHAATVRPSADA